MFNFPLIIHKNNLVRSTILKIRQHILQIPQLFYLKRDLTGSMGLLRHFPTDLVNRVIDELINYQLVRQGSTYSNISSLILLLTIKGLSVFGGKVDFLFD